MKLLPLLSAVCLSLLCVACDETDVAAVRLVVNPDLSGTISASALEQAGDTTRAPITLGGASWKSRVNLVCATGSFEKLGGLTLSDVALSAGEGQGGLCFLRLALPRGADVRWARELVPLDARERKEATAAFDNSGALDEVGSTLKFQVTLPSDAIGNGVTGRTRGTKVKAEGNVATLVVPIETALSPGDPIVWHLTWQK